MLLDRKISLEDERRMNNAHTIKWHLLWPFLPLTNTRLEARARLVSVTGGYRAAEQAGGPEVT
jgi:hypothetical protein